MNKKESPFFQNIALWISGAAISVMTLIVAINSIARYFFNSPLVMVEEVATSMFAWVVFLGASVCYKEKMHIGIDCFVNFLPVTLRRSIGLFVDLLLITANLYMTYLSFSLTNSAWTKFTPTLRMPYSYIDAAALIGFFLMSVHSIRFFITDIRNFNSPDITPEQEEEL
ncbi:TRAP transporter small permease [Oscillospiraceae bacterium PP1C4]